MIQNSILTSHADFQKYNFFRSPEWRFERILSLIDREDGVPGRCSRRDDEYVRVGRSFIHRHREGDDAMREKLKWENAGLYFAYDYHQRLAADPDVAMYIQARLLAKQTPEQIGNILGIMPAAVEWYAVLFFDVVPYLDQRDWITKAVLIPAIVRSPLKDEDDDNNVPMHRDIGIAKPFLDGSLKLMAYFGGPHIVDMLLTSMQPGRPVTNPDDASGWFDKIHCLGIRQRSAQVTRLFPINKYNVMELFATHARLMELDRSEDSISASNSNHERHIQTMIDGIPWAAGGDGETLYKNTVVGRFDNMSSELRDDELLQLASGRVVVDIDTNFPKALPAPRKNVKATLTSNDTELP